MEIAKKYIRESISENNLFGVADVYSCKRNAKNIIQEFIEGGTGCFT